MLRRELFVLGWRGEPPRCDGLRVRSLTIGALAGAVSAAPGGVVLVLGDAALHRAAPEFLASMGKPPICILLGVLDRRDDALVARWCRATEIDFTTREALADRVFEATGIPLRPAIPLESWLWPTAHGPRPTAHGPRPTAKGAASRRTWG